MNSQIWFHRPSKTKCTVCELFYIPHQDCQLYCHSCNLWFHLGCLGVDDPKDLAHDHIPSINQPPLDVDKLGEDGFPAVFEEVLWGPTLRGHWDDYDNYDWDNNWFNTGSGVQALMRQWVGEGACPDDWLAQLGEIFLEDFRAVHWKFFTRPTCGGKV